MKTLIKSLLLAFSVGIITSATTISEAKPIGRPSGVATYKSGIYTSNTGRLNIALDKQTGGSVDIQFKSAEGRVLYREHLGKKDRTCRTRLNLNDLEDGVYVLEITNGVETTRQHITIATGKPERTVRAVALSDK